MVLLTPLIALWSVQVLGVPHADPAPIPSGHVKAIDSVIGDIGSENGNKGMLQQLLSSLENITPAAAPTSIPDVLSRLKRAHARSRATGYVRKTMELVREGIVTQNIGALPEGFKTVNNDNNVNTREPSKPIFPKRSPGDAPYLQSATEMRKQIYIPSSFTYGKKPPVLLVPGTGERGGNSFTNNYIKTLAGTDNADTVWINPPGFELADAQNNSETVAYAINYISGISNNRNVTIIGWSQGCPNIQWALKYWPSARKVTTAVIANSGDYHGTVVANLLDPLEAVALPPSVIQQKYNSNFVKALRSNGGDSAYVPTTNIYSGFFDEIVEPQQGTEASGYLKDARGVGVTNAEINTICPRDSPAGVFTDHESVLFNALTHALAMDVVKHGGHANMNRIDLKTVCQQSAAPGLSLQDVLGTESTIPFALFQIVAYNPKAVKEPKLRSYAL